MVGGEGGETGVDNDFMRRGQHGIGATIQQFLRASLPDEVHLAIVAILLGDGERLLANVGRHLQQLRMQRVRALPRRHPRGAHPRRLSVTGPGRRADARKPTTNSTAMALANAASRNAQR